MPLISTPEETAVVVLDVIDELVEVWGRRGEVVLVELEVLITPVERPLSPNLRVPKSTDREPSPLRAEVGAPPRPTFEQRDVAICHVDLVANLLPHVRFHILVATFGPSPDPSDVQIRKHDGHATETRIADQSNQPTLTFMSVGHRADVRHSAFSEALIRAHDHRPGRSISGNPRPSGRCGASDTCRQLSPRGS
jgi:hypothetical protein